MNYSLIIPAVVLYILIFWVIVSGWLFFDAKKRYRSWKKAVMISLLNLIFQLPFLIFYLLVRPFDGEEQLLDTDAAAEQSMTGGVNVPLINFVGNEGVVMTLELKINSPKLATESHPEMKIDVNFESADPEKQLIVKPLQESVDKTGNIKVTQAIGEVVEIKKPAGIAGKIKTVWARWKKSAQARKEAAARKKAEAEVERLAEKISSEKPVKPAVQVTGPAQILELPSKKHKKKKNKKKH